MIVVDASAILELLLRTSASDAVGRRLFRSTETLHAPHLIDVEVMQVLRRYARNRSVALPRLEEALEDFHAIQIERYSHELLLPRIWELRDNLSAYDAAYIALSELLRAPLVTFDTKLAGAPSHDVKIELLDRASAGSGDAIRR